jgi:hypothetical protein
VASRPAKARFIPGKATDRRGKKLPHQLFDEAVQKAADAAGGGRFRLVAQDIRVSPNPGRIDEYSVVLERF